MKPHSHFILFIILFFSASVHSQIDSLEKVLAVSKQDTARIRVLNMLTTEYRSIDTAKAFGYARQAIALSRELKSLKGFGDTYFRMGGVYRFKRDFEKAISSYNEALVNYKIANDQKGLIKTHSMIGEVYRQKGEYDHAFDQYSTVIDLATKQKDTAYLIDAIGGYANIYRYKGDYVNSLANYLKALQLAERTNDLDQQAGLLTNMALVYDYQTDTAAELNAYQRAFDINVQLKDSSDMILGSNNLGIYYYEHHAPQKAQERFAFSLQLISKLGDERAGLKYVAQTYENLGMMAFDSANYKRAQNMYSTALDYWLKTKQKKGISMGYGELADVDIALKDWSNAKDHLLQKLQLSTEIEYRQGEMEADQALANVMYQLGEYKSAYDYQSRYVQLNDSMLNNTKTSQLVEMQTKYESAEKEKVLRERDAEIKRKNDEDALKTKVLYALIGVIIIFFALAFFSWRQFMQRRRAFVILKGQHEEMQAMNTRISEQKEVIDAKNKDITDSIQYAKRIQGAILPHENEVKSLLRESFIYYKPKDIISGDIYWVYEQGDVVYLAVIDCTGHGVPGALMSIIAQNGLKSAFNGISTPSSAAVIGLLSRSIRETFRSNEQYGQINDGMDIGLLSIDRRKMSAGFAGANIPMILVRNGEVSEIKSDKRLIEGNSSRAEQPFTQHDLPLQKGDMLYLFTDGFADQFGGEFEKRFSSKELKRTLCAISGLSMQEQENKLNETFQQWKGSLEQIDDVLMIGVRI